MNEPRRILAVDEQKKTLDFLQSVLSLVEGERFEVLHVLSAEEGLLELRRRAYDLMICALRLPGMDGLELIRRSKRLRPIMPVILIAQQIPADLRDRAARLGVNRVMRRPLDAEKFLEAVQQSLAVAPRASGREERGGGNGLVAVSDAVVRRLQALYDETGATQVLLATVSGEILHVAGGQLQRNAPRLVALTAASVSRALEVSRQLDESEPRAVQFVAGKTTDMYWANAGGDHFIILTFDARVRRGRIGTVWVFTQRAVHDLKGLLGEQPPAASPRTAPAREAARPARQLAQAPPSKAIQTEAAVTPEMDGAVEALMPEDAAAEAQERTPEDLALDAYWEEALADDDGLDAHGAGISLEEAKAKGLVSEDFDPEGAQTDR